MGGDRQGKTDTLQRLLACPRCVKARLDTVKDGYRCRRCETEFPALDGIPWLFANPGVAWGEWRQRLDFARKTLAADAARIDVSLENPALRASTRARLEHLRGAHAAQAEVLADLMTPLELGALEANYATYLALRTRLPSDHGLHTYYPNLHRDWGWGEEENRVSASLVAEALEGAARDTLLVLGSGASRLAYDLHQEGGWTQSVALDFNPMLLLVAKTMCAGDTLDLFEFPIAPRSASEVALRQTLRAPAPARPGLDFVLGDALRAPFAAGSFDAVLTPWFVDVVPEELSRLSARVNPLLRAGGRWVVFGSLAFSNRDAAYNYGPEEALEIVAEAGFDTPVLREETIPYMDSPHSRHGRREQVVVLSARKNAEHKTPPRHVALPDYLVKSDEPVPLLEAFRLQATTTRIHAALMSLVDGKRSIAEMATMLAENGFMSRDEAETSVRNFLIKMFDEAQRPSGL